MRAKRNFVFIIALLLSSRISAQQIISEHEVDSSFTIFNGDRVPNRVVGIYTDKNDAVLVQKAAGLLQNDIELVTGAKPGMGHIPIWDENIIVIGTLESRLIKQLIQSKKLNVSKIRGKWEAYQVQVVQSPLKGIGKALVIVGSDRRGTAYGVLELSRQMGVSPWYWWADVPVKKKTRLFVKNIVAVDSPLVKYRGIFINDEAPALSGWSKEKFGGFNHVFYEKVFELMLRLKSNYLWPAMWGNAFYDDDSLNKQTADDYGIVIGTSHHEPLMRAHD